MTQTFGFKKIDFIGIFLLSMWFTTSKFKAIECLKFLDPNDASYVQVFYTSTHFTNELRDVPTNENFE